MTFCGGATLSEGRASGLAVAVIGGEVWGIELLTLALELLLFNDLLSDFMLH